MNLREFVIRRLALAVPIFFLAVTLIFVILHSVPGDPISMIVAEMRYYGASRQQIEALKAYYGLDKPIWEQYLMWISHVLQGNFGYSIPMHAPVMDLIGPALLNTFILIGPAFAISALLSIYLGVVCATRQYSKTDNLASFFSLFTWSMPGFWTSIMVLLVFSLYLGWFPSSGMQTPGFTGTPLEMFTDRLSHLALPLFVNVAGSLAMNFRLVRSCMLEVLREDYIVTARSKGLRERIVVYKHALRNALLPVVTSLALGVRWIFMGSTLIEFVFTWPGIGRLTLQAAVGRDYPLLMGATSVLTIVTILSNLIADVLYAIIDPRVRY